MAVAARPASAAEPVASRRVATRRVNSPPTAGPSPFLLRNETLIWRVTKDGQLDKRALGALYEPRTTNPWRSTAASPSPTPNSATTKQSPGSPSDHHRYLAAWATFGRTGPCGPSA